MNNLHYPDLERCKKLKEIGFPGTEYRKWKYCVNGEYAIFNPRFPKENKLAVKDSFPYPSVMEMLDVIPEKFSVNLDKNWIVRLGNYEEEKERSGNYKNLCMVLGDKIAHDALGETMPNALADMILWLHENKHISFTR